LPAATSGSSNMVRKNGRKLSRNISCQMISMHMLTIQKKSLSKP